MKIVVAVVVYDRINNIKRWIHCWKMCNTENAELVIIDNSQSSEIKALCKDHIYISRENIGFDIGAMQDVFNNKLTGFPDYDFLLWCCDDTLPMSKDFINPFIESMLPGVGLTCMQIASSTQGEIHVRTTGFCIRKDVAKQIKFPVEKVKTKQQCYLFEHRGGKNTLTNQIREMGLSCVQVAPNNISPLFDTEYWRRLERMNEHEQLFGYMAGNKVAFICTIYNSYPQIISSLICQTHKDWELILIHDGRNVTGLKEIIPNDARIKYIETNERVGKWGHYHRQWALNEMLHERLSNPDYIVITNADNYYVPVFTEYMLKGFKGKHTVIATYCNSMTHSYVSWKNISVKFERGFIDSGGVMIKKDIACGIGWRDIENHSSDWTYFSDIAAKYNSCNFIAVEGNLFIHN